MAADELKKLLDDEEKKTPDPALGEKKSEENKTEEQKAAERLSNINKAIEEANGTLRAKRKALKEGKVDPEEEELPKIDLNDPNSKAWDKHFSDKVNPLQDEMAKEKDEVRTYALKTFLSDKPELAKDPEAIKRVMGTYEKIRVATERTTEGVLIDLKKAYAAEFSDEILGARQNERIDEARGSALFSDIAVSRGSSYIPTEKEKLPHVSNEDAAILAKWGMSPTEWAKLKIDTDKKRDK